MKIEVFVFITAAAKVEISEWKSHEIINLKFYIPVLQLSSLMNSK